MRTYDQNGTRRPLPKFGDWNVNDPASADGYTVIFSKARDEKKAKSTGDHSSPPPPAIKKDVSPARSRSHSYDPSKKNWLCCF